jgi:hypothetical protein
MQLVGAARRRTFANLVCEQLSVGLIAAMAGAILLLLTGTQILDWWWPLVLFVAGAGLSAWRTRQLMPSPYKVAQIVDRRLGLQDLISTAFHFLQPAARPGSPDLVAAHCTRAEEAASTVDVAAAIPWRLPRQFMPALALAGVGAVLFVVRYGTSGRLDLSKPIVESVADFFQLAPEKTLAKNGKAPKLPGQDPLGIDINQPDMDRQKLDQATDEALQVVDTPDPNAGTKDESKIQQQQVKAAGDKAGDDQSESTEEGERADSAPNEKSGDGESGKTGDQVAKDQKADQAAKQAGGENSSLMDKMRDAMANLMSKLKVPQQQGTGQKQQASNQKGGQKQPGDQQQSGQGQKGEKGQGNPQGKGSPSDDPDSKGNEPGEQQAQAGQGQSNDKGQEGGSPNEAKAGMGKQDGSKDIKDAEQQAAMGKLSEIYGKRAENIRGDVMVEVTSSKQQQLRTGYAQRGAAHGDSGGEVHRDEIPQHLQHYVQQYFEQVRKGEPNVTAPAPTPPAPVGKGVQQ